MDVSIEKDKVAFMKINLPEGNNTIQFTYRPQWIIFSAIISCFLYLEWFVESVGTVWYRVGIFACTINITEDIHFARG